MNANGNTSCTTVGSHVEVYDLGERFATFVVQNNLTDETVVTSNE